MGLKVFTTPSIPLTGDRNPSRKGKDVTALQGFFLKSSRPSLLIKRAALGNLKASFHWTHWHRFFPLKKAFLKTYPSFLTLKEGSTFLTKPLSPQGREDVTALRCSEPLRSKVGGPSKVYARLCGMGPPGDNLAMTIAMVVRDGTAWRWRASPIERDSVGKYCPNWFVVIFMDFFSP